MIRIGCSGYSYQDWLSFYGNSKVDKLTFYSSRFPGVEINTTFYAIPSRGTVERWVRKTHGVRNFRYVLKVPEQISHRLSSIKEPEIQELTELFSSNCIDPIRNAGQLAGVLLQLPPSADESWVEMIGSFMDNISVSGKFLEIRSKQEEFQEHIKKLSEGWEVDLVSVDRPNNMLKQINPRGRSAYIRLHGRNSRLWNDRNAGLSRYLYDYSRTELEEIAGIINRDKSSFEDVYVFFNNHPGGNAPRNALSLTEMLDSERPSTGQSRLA